MTFSDFNPTNFFPVDKNRWTLIPANYVGWTGDEDDRKTYPLTVIKGSPRRWTTSKASSRQNASVSLIACPKTFDIAGPELVDKWLVRDNLEGTDYRIVDAKFNGDLRPSGGYRSFVRFTITPLRTDSIEDNDE